MRSPGETSLPFWKPLLFYLLGALLVAGPWLPRLGDRFLGHPHSDMWKHLWGLWWFRECLMERKTLPLFSSDLNFPQGGYLYFADPLNALLSLPLQALLPLPMAYNLLVLGHLVAGAMGAFLLVRHVCRHHGAALVGGTAYGFCPLVLGYSLDSGVTETLHLAWLPLHLVALLRLLERPSARGAVLPAALFLGLTAFASWYYGLFALLFDAVLLAGWAWAHRPRRTAGGFWRPMAPRLRRAWGERMRVLGRVLVLAGLLLFPYLVAFRMVVRSPYNLVAPRGSPVRSRESFLTYLGEEGDWSVNLRGERGHFNYATLLGFVTPGKGRATVTVSVDRLTRTYYLGFLLLGLIVLAWLPAAAVRPIPPPAVPQGSWTAAFLLFVVLSLGPVVHLDDRPGSRLFTSWLYLAFYRGFPFFDQVAHPFRMLVPALLAGGVVAGLGFRRLEAWMPPRMRGRLALPLAGLVLAETLFLSPAPYPLDTASSRVPEFYRQLASDPKVYGVLDLPFERPGSILLPGEYFYYQTVHGKPLPYRTSGMISEAVRKTAFHMGVREILAPPADRPSTRADPVQLLARGAAELREMGFVYVVLHPALAARRGSLEQALEQALGRPVQEGEVVVYRLQEPRDAPHLRPPHPPGSVVPASGRREGR